MTLRRYRRVTYALVLALTACGSGMRFEPMNVEDPGGDLGLRPPREPEFQACYSGHASGLDTNSDGRADEVRVQDDFGRETCHGTDSDHNGKVDQWDVMDEHGHLAKRVRDTNNDGRADQRWSFDPAQPQCGLLSTDRDGDGNLDSPVEICAVNTTTPTNVGTHTSAPAATATAPATPPTLPRPAARASGTDAGAP